MTTPDATTVWLMFWGISIGSGALFAVVGYLVYKLVDFGRSWVIMLPSIPRGEAKIARKKMRKGEISFKIPGSHEQELVRTSPLGAYPTMRGPLHIIGRETGWNLVAPSKDDRPEGVNEEEYQAMRVCDPLTYYRATKENDWEDFLAAQQGKDHWLVRAAPWLFLGLLAVMGALAFGIWKVLPLIERGMQ